MVGRVADNNEKLYLAFIPFFSFSVAFAHFFVPYNEEPVFLMISICS